MGPAIDRSYAGADLEVARLIVGGLWLLSGLISALFLPFDPPVERIGSAGWVLAAAIILTSVGAGAVLVRRRLRPGVNALLAISYVGLAEVTVLVWLGGGAGAAYQTLGLIWIGSAMGVHPPARALTFLAVATAAFAAPLVYDGWSSDAAASIGSDLLLWAILGVVILLLIRRVRRQRVELRAEEERAQQLARADSLTGLGNRRAFDEAIAAEISRSARAESTTSVVILDIDEFKALNDRFGHIEGDRCLREVADALGEAVRGGDRAFRWGGDEFALLLPDTNLVAAQEVGERVAGRVRSRCADADGQPMTISWGAAEAAGGTSVEDLLTHADLALMRFKRERRRDPESPEPDPAP